MPEQKTIARRRFIGLLGGAVGAGALTCCGLGALGTVQPHVEYRESTCGGETMGKILVAYASKAGSTGEVAEAIGQMLCEGGASVDVRLAKEVSDLSPYRAVVMGSAIRIGRWLPEAVKFVEQHQAVLATMPVAYFQVSGSLKEDTPEKRQEAATYLGPVRALVAPASVGLFAGKMDYSKLSFLDRTIAKMVGSVEGDWRDWEAIRAWADSLRPVLVSA
jgi:menaquinone-dependent protoporphyrinogen oxidase